MSEEHHLLMASFCDDHGQYNKADYHRLSAEAMRLARELGEMSMFSLRYWAMSWRLARIENRAMAAWRKLNTVGHPL